VKPVIRPSLEHVRFTMPLERGKFRLTAAREVSEAGVTLPLRHRFGAVKRWASSGGSCVLLARSSTHAWGFL
jgi:hypothetical protein